MAFMTQSVVTALCERCGHTENYSDKDIAFRAGWRQVLIRGTMDSPRLICPPCRLSLTTWFQNERPEPIDWAIDRHDASKSVMRK
jgi:hypothetical protein